MEFESMVEIDQPGRGKGIYEFSKGFRYLTGSILIFMVLSLIFYFLCLYFFYNNITKSLEQFSNDMEQFQTDSAALQELSNIVENICNDTLFARFCKD